MGNIFFLYFTMLFVVYLRTAGYGIFSAGSSFVLSPKHGLGGSCLKLWDFSSGILAVLFFSRIVFGRIYVLSSRTEGPPKKVERLYRGKQVVTFLVLKPSSVTIRGQTQPTKKCKKKLRCKCVFLYLLHLFFGLFLTWFPGELVGLEGYRLCRLQYHFNMFFHPTGIGNRKHPSSWQIRGARGLDWNPRRCALGKAEMGKK